MDFIQKDNELIHDCLNYLYENDWNFMNFLDKPSYHSFELFREGISNGIENNEYVCCGLNQEEVCVNVCSGASRGVLVFCPVGDIDEYSADVRRLFNYVVKFDLSDEKYTEKELENYEYAVDEGLEDYFAEIHRGGNFDGVDYYVMERTECDEDRSSSEMYLAYCKKMDMDSESGETADEFYGEPEENILHTFIESFYGTEVADDIEMFCEEHDINDIHNGNIGYLNDKPIIIDYAGYY